MVEDEVEQLPEEENQLDQRERVEQIESAERHLLESAEGMANNNVNIAPRRPIRAQRHTVNNANGQSSTRRRVRKTAEQRVTAIQNAIRRSNGLDLEYKQKILRALTQITHSFEMVVEQQADTNLMFWQAVAAESRNFRPALYTQFKTEVIEKLAEYLLWNQRTYEHET
uniref:Uncharacterized protein n=1 Tax=Anopheles funestus TaxID=62324 RepID=A0A182S437_ANOFN